MRGYPGGELGRDERRALRIRAEQGDGRVEKSRSWRSRRRRQKRIRCGPRDGRRAMRGRTPKKRRRQQSTGWNFPALVGVWLRAAARGPVGEVAIPRAFEN